MADLVPNLINDSVAISACERVQQWQQALSLLAAMQETNLVPDAIVYHVAISDCENAHSCQQTLGLVATGVCAICDHVLSCHRYCIAWEGRLRR